MSRYEYKVIPSPRRGVKAKGAKTNRDKFAYALTELMNEQARDGWEYQRAESLPADEKPGFLKSAVEIYQSVLVFRREVMAAQPVHASGTLRAMPAAVPVAAAPERAEPQFSAPPSQQPVLTLGAQHAAPELGPARKD